jgi:hypothetical protein
VDKAVEVGDHNLFYGFWRAAKTGQRDKNEPLSSHREETMFALSELPHILNISMSWGLGGLKKACQGRLLPIRIASNSEFNALTTT